MLFFNDGKIKRTDVAGHRIVRFLLWRRKSNKTKRIIMKIKKEYIIGIIFSVLFTILACVMPTNREVLLFFNMVIVALTLAKTKLSIISLWSIITNYVMINVYAYDVTGNAYGVLGMTNISFVTMLKYMMIFNVCLYIWASSTRILYYEKQMLSFSEFNPGKTFTIICSIIAVFAILIAFPTIPFAFNFESRFQALLPGNAWNHLAIIALLYMVPNIKKYRIVVCTYIFVCFWFLSHYERVDVIGFLIVLVFIYFMKNNKKKNEWIKYIKISILGMMVFAVLSFLGEARMGSNFSITSIVRKLVTQNTASDVGYVYDVAIKYSDDHKLLNGATYLRYLCKFIPGINTNDLIPNVILGKHYWLPGGEFLLSEPIINFGILGVIVIPNLWIFLVYILISKQTKLRYIIYLFLLVTPFRYLWYGVEFIETGIVIFIPAMYFIYKMCGKGNVKYDLC